jgi:hypothetical protein
MPPLVDSTLEWTDTQTRGAIVHTSFPDHNDRSLLVPRATTRKRPSSSIVTRGSMLSVDLSIATLPRDEIKSVRARGG